jgi:hypothetical protein
MDLAATFADRLQSVQDRIVAACRRANRSADAVALVAVTKSAPDELLPILQAARVRDCGESRPQELVRRAGLAPELRWHLIGHLQRNKVRAVLPCTVLVHSVDSLRLLMALAAEAERQNRIAHVLLEVNVSGETSKQGWSPDGLRAEWTRLLRVRGVAVDGLMTMAPWEQDPESTRPVFRSLRRLGMELRPEAHRCGHAFEQLSMGMTNDFEVAIEEGATLVRVGSALFEGLPTSE